MDRWVDKVAVVTGASSGIGAACCAALLGEGMIVVGLARRLERMEKVLKPQFSEMQQKRFHPLKCDISVEQDIQTAFEWFEKNLDGVDVLINNAGIVRHTKIIAQNNSADLRAILDVNVMGPALCTREAFRSMKKRGINGHVIMINSIVGHKPMMIPGRSLNMYAPSKYAVTAMTEVLRQEFMINETKIKVTSISPGLVHTEIVGQGMHFPEGYPILKPVDIADAIIFCLQTPPHVQIHEIVIKPVGERM